MKRKDWLIIAMIVVVAGIFSYVLANTFVASPKNRQEKVEVVEKISNVFETPDKKYFNEQAFDPTKLIQIGDSTNQKPFNGTN